MPFGLTHLLGLLPLERTSLKSIHRNFIFFFISHLSSLASYPALPAPRGAVRVQIRVLTLVDIRTLINNNREGCPIGGSLFPLLRTPLNDTTYCFNMTVYIYHRLVRFWVNLVNLRDSPNRKYCNPCDSYHRFLQVLPYPFRILIRVRIVPKFV